MIELIKEGDWSSPRAKILEQAYLIADQLDHKLSEFVMTMPGMSGKKYRTLINRLIENTPDARYLEVGSWKGSTACSAMFGNKVNVTCIDNYSFGGFTKDDLVSNTSKVITDNINFNLIDSDFRQVDYNSIGKFNVYFFDGPHSERDQYDGVVVAQPALDDTYILIIDDWNGPEVRRGTGQAIKDLNLNVECVIDIRTIDPTVTNESSDWHFGYFLAVVTKDKQ